MRAVQGVAYTDIPEGSYFPAVSLFTHPRQVDAASVEVNFGDKSFAHPPPLLSAATREPLQGSAASPADGMIRPTSLSILIRPEDVKE